MRPQRSVWTLGATLLVLTLAVGCDDDGTKNVSDGGGANAGDSGPGGGDGATPDGGGTSVPTVLSTLPASGATAVAINTSIAATFSEAMDPKTLTATTFTVTSGAAGVSVPGQVIYADSQAVFWPAAHLASNTAIAASLSTQAKSAAGVALAERYSWTFTTGDALAAITAVRLGTAANYAILAKTGISTVAISPITGDIGVSPIDSTAITGFSLQADASTEFATSAQVNGKVYAADYKAPTPAILTAAVSDMELGFTDAASRAPDETELDAGMIGGKTLAPGVYKWGTGVLIASDVTLEGGATDVWIFQIAKGLTVGSGAKVVLKGEAVPQNIFWQVTEAVEIGTTAHMEGIVLSAKAITLRTKASINGRLLAQTAVVLDQSTVTQPSL